MTYVKNTIHLKKMEICRHENCKELAMLFRDYCVDHCTIKKCKHPSCSNETFSFEDSDYCIQHWGWQHTCQIPNCTTKVRTEKTFCVEHRRKHNQWCPNCIDWIDSRSGNKKYDGWCARCFKQEFPNDPRSKISYNSRELLVRKRIDEEFDGFIHDKTMYTGHCDCTHRRRIDHRKLVRNTMIAVETDEFGHRYYDKVDEIIRYDDLYMIFSGKWIYIRFNPDNNVSKVDFEKKLDTLIDTIRACIEKIENEENDDLVEIIKLFY